ARRRGGAEPSRDLRPAVDGSAPPCDERDVPTRQLDVFLLATPDLVDERPYTLGGRDVVFLRADDEDRARDALEPGRATANDELVAVELVVLIEVAYPLPEELTRERHVLVRPLVQGLEAFEVLVVPYVLPEAQVRREVHRRLEQLEPGLDHVGRHRAERVDETVDVELVLAEPEPAQPEFAELHA